MKPRTYYLSLAQQFGVERALDAALLDLEAMRQLVESYRAVSRLPVPPSSIGDGPDERVGWALSLMRDVCEAVEAYRVAREVWHRDSDRKSYSLEEARNEMFEVASECLGALDAQPASRLFTCAHCGLAFASGGPGIVLNVVRRDGQEPAYGCSNFCGDQIQHWSSEQWDAFSNRNQPSPVTLPLYGLRHQRPA